MAGHASGCEGRLTGAPGAAANSQPAPLHALEAMKPYTLMKRDEQGRESDVFENRSPACAGTTSAASVITIGDPQALGHPSPARQLHAPNLLHGGTDGGYQAAYIAAQAGHSIKMPLDMYARWIPANDGCTARSRLAEAMGGNSSPEVPQRILRKNEKPGKPLSINDLPGADGGRRDWTRTNDPHHVKVVL